jgi:hypothetical protein
MSRRTDLLQTPPKKNLCFGLPRALDYALERLFSPTSPLGEWRPCLNEHIVLLTPFDDVLALQPRMEFNLIDAKDATLSFAELQICLLDVILKLFKMLQIISTS